MEMSCVNVPVAIDGDDAGHRIFGCRQSLTLEDRAERDIPGLIANFGGHCAGHILADDNRAPGKSGERRDHVADVGVLERHRYRWLLRL